MALQPASLNWIIMLNVNTFNMENIIGYQKKYIKKNLIYKGHIFLAEQYIHNVITAVGNNKLRAQCLCLSNGGKGCRTSLTYTFVPGHMYQDMLYQKISPPEKLL